MKLLLKVLAVIVALLITAMGMVIYNFKKDAMPPYPPQVIAPDLVPKFQEVPTDFVHQFKKDKSLPLMGSAIIDVDKDGVEEIFVGGGYEQQDALLQFKGDHFENIADRVNLPKKGLQTTLGTAVVDINNDGWSDMFVAREGGVHLYINGGGVFTASKTNIKLNDKSTPVSFAANDVNRDGYIDLFVSGYIPLEQMEGQTIFNDTLYGASSILVLNNGDNTFTDVTEKAGLSYIHNTFQAVFVEVDNDTLADLIVAHDTGQVRTYKNMGDTTFQIMPNPTTDYFAYPMGIAVGDYNGDHRMDFFFSNIGTTIPEFMARGDLTPEQALNGDWILFRNEEGFKFTDVSGPTLLANYEFSWGAVMADFNLDGRQDLAVSENYINFPPHSWVKLPCRFLIQTENETFTPAGALSGVTNPHYSITPLVSDFNSDGYPDLVHVNLNGPLRAFISEGGDRNWLKVQLKEDARSLGALVTIEKDDGSKLTDCLVNGEGLCSDQSHILTFGLNKSKAVKYIVVRYLTGEMDTVMNPVVNTLVKVN